MGRIFQGYKHNVSACLRVEELAAFNKLHADRGGSRSAIVREGLLRLLEENGYLPTDGKKAS